MIQIPFEHKAFVFDYEGFESNLKDILESALVNGSTRQLSEYIFQNQAYLKDPYEGEELSEDWEALIEIQDPHQYGDFALTNLYNPTEDIGLGYEWENVQEILSQRLTDISLVQLGGNPYAISGKG